LQLIDAFASGLRFAGKCFSVGFRFGCLVR
jgi:hypothetical protein